MIVLVGRNSLCSYWHLPNQILPLLPPRIEYGRVIELAVIEIGLNGLFSQINIDLLVIKPQNLHCVLFLLRTLQLLLFCNNRVDALNPHLPDYLLPHSISKANLLGVLLHAHQMLVRLLY